MERTYRIVLDDYEWRIVINVLNDLRTSLIKEERYTDAVDDVLIKSVEAKQRKLFSGGNTMEQTIHNEQNGLDYTLCGDYYLPNLLPPHDEYKIGIYGQRNLIHIKEHDKILYTNLLTSGKLGAFLAEIDERTQNMKAVLIKQMAEQEGVNEMLKEQNQMEWVQKMNNLRNRVEEIVLDEILK